MDFIKINCAENGEYCRSRKLNHFPTFEIFMPAPDESESFIAKMRFRLLKGPGNYSVCPFHSDFSYEGFKAALQELFLVPKKDPYADVKSFLQVQINEKYLEAQQKT